MNQFLNSREVMALIGAMDLKDIYLLVKYHILSPFGEEFRFRFSSEEIENYLAMNFENGIPRADLVNKCVRLRRLGYSMEMIVEITYLPLTWVRSILEDRGMGRGYRAGTNGTHGTNRFEVGKIDQARVVAMRKGGRTLVEIGKAFGVSYGTIRNILEANLAEAG